MSDNKFWSDATGKPAVYGPDDPWWHDQQDEEDAPNAERSTAVVLGDIWDAGGVVLYDTPANLRRYLHDALRLLDLTELSPMRTPGTQ
ncbi:hypothetical protein [Micromonospora endolithica]|uniref:Uncharacterized protein n=1 Tax=Micromonospora endolithica TaxID=230091 RepID=A0A3A9ZSM6_9ACTN|nr:hypothetical protein [Micromonospora endolithica]RKN50467.1 hypothetical protein D7223_01335 [Micromonospora endolithica]TWJ20845.1 hypothetical protein JD76_00945 [Micromonospora endolithica]